VITIGQYDEHPAVFHIYTLKLGWQMLYTEGANHNQEQEVLDFVLGGFLAYGFQEYYSANYGFDGQKHNRVLLATTAPEEVCLERFGAKPKRLIKRRIKHGRP